MSDLTDLLHKLIDAVQRPSDVSAEDLHAEVDKLDTPAPAPEPAPEPDPVAAPEPVDAPAPVDDVSVPAPFGTEDQPEAAGG